jgi:hypothetical protein
MAATRNPAAVKALIIAGSSRCQYFSTPLWPLPVVFSSDHC